jgi:hypothetical protein
MPVSPSTDNYYVGKGKISFKPTGAVSFCDIGNVTELETTPNVTTLEHFSSREGVRRRTRRSSRRKSSRSGWSWTRALARRMMDDIADPVVAAFGVVSRYPAFTAQIQMAR